MTFFLFFSLAFTYWLGCNTQWSQVNCTDTTLEILDTSTNDPKARFRLPYQLSEATESFVMPPHLKEISGLSMSGTNDNWLTAIQDEAGILFYINKETGEVEKEITYYKGGDYEGVEVVGDITYIAKSTGTIYEVTNLDSMPPAIQKHNTFLTKENNVEGLCYDAASNRLLLACKGFSFTDEQSEANQFERAIYSFDLATNQMELNPVFIFKLSDFQHFLKDKTYLAEYDKLHGYFFEPEEEGFIFSPSAIAIHPLTGELYMTSSVKKLLMVFDAAGKIIHLEKMDKNIHPQPEGLAFDKDGTLYIANEGKERVGTILKFNYQRDRE
jgi:uncharacterized protein YjiK